MQQFRGLAARAPYFAEWLGQESSRARRFLRPAVQHSSIREQEKQDLVNFLSDAVECDDDFDDDAELKKTTGMARRVVFAAHGLPRRSAQPPQLRRNFVSLSCRAGYPNTFRAGFPEYRGRVGTTSAFRPTSARSSIRRTLATKCSSKASVSDEPRICGGIVPEACSSFHRLPEPRRVPATRSCRLSINTPCLSRRVLPGPAGTLAFQDRRQRRRPLPRQPRLSRGRESFPFITISTCRSRAGTPRCSPEIVERRDMPQAPGA